MFNSFYNSLEVIWNLFIEANEISNVGPDGLEPSTHGLKGHCFTYLSKNLASTDGKQKETSSDSLKVALDLLS